METNNLKKIIVHSGSYHADDVLCIGMVNILEPGILVERTREISQEDINNHDVIVADVGGILDVSKRCYDHHQDSDLNAACYHMWNDLGRSIIEKIMKVLPEDKVTYPNGESIPVQQVKMFIQTGLIKSISDYDTNKDNYNYRMKTLSELDNFKTISQMIRDMNNLTYIHDVMVDSTMNLIGVSLITSAIIEGFEHILGQYVWTKRMMSDKKKLIILNGFYTPTLAQAPMDRYPFQSTFTDKKFTIKSRNSSRFPLPDPGDLNHIFYHKSKFLCIFDNKLDLDIYIDQKL